jgi:hypothetical protein
MTYNAARGANGQGLDQAGAPPPNPPAALASPGSNNLTHNFIGLDEEIVFNTAVIPARSDSGSRDTNNTMDDGFLATGSAKQNDISNYRAEIFIDSDFKDLCTQQRRHHAKAD